MPKKAMSLRTYSDGGARGNPGPAAIGVVLCDERDEILLEASHSVGETTNNVAEYSAMIHALELAKARGARRLLCTSDSELLIFQLQGVYRIKDLRLKELAEKVKSLVSGFERVEFRQVPREHPMIKRADKLLNQTLNRTKAAARLRRPPGGPMDRPGKKEPGSPIQGELF